MSGYILILGVYIDAELIIFSSSGAINGSNWAIERRNVQKNTIKIPLCCNTLNTL